MTASKTTTFPNASTADRPPASRPRRVHMILRDGAMLDGRIVIADGQTLAFHLGSRKGGWVSILDAVWAADDEHVPHVLLQADHLALAASSDRDIPVVTGTAVAVQRRVQITLENDVRLQGCLLLAEGQRLCDYLHAVGKFLPIAGTTRMSDGAEPGDIALNGAAIRLVRDLAVSEASETVPPAAVDEAYRVFLIDGVPVTRQVMRTDAGSLTLLTPGRVPDRRSNEAGPRATPDCGGPPTATPAALEVELVPHTAEQALGVQRAAWHWMGQMAAQRGMAPPVGRLLSASPTIAELWRALCAANDLAEAELAAIVAAECRLPLASVDAIDANAVAQIPGKIARRLGALPVALVRGVLHIATADPLNPSLEQQLRFVTKRRVEVEVAAPSSIAGALDWWYPDCGADTDRA